MTATITDQFKREITQDILKQYDSGDRYYIAVGRAEEWPNNVPPGVSQLDYLQSQEWSRSTRLSLQSAKRVFNVSYVIPRYNWTTGTIYYGSIDDVTDVTDNNKHYVMNDQNQVYMCLKAGITGSGALAPSIIQPTGTSSLPFKTGDGYFWKFMYTISVADTDKYVTTKFIPVKFVDSAGPDDPATDIQQKIVQDAALPKQIIGYEILYDGAGSYSTPPNITVVGNGSGAQARSVISNAGNLISVEVDSNGTSTGWQFGTGYDYANCVVEGTARVRPILSQPQGLGGNPTQDLRATRLMFNVQLIDDEENTIIASGQDFRQMVLLKDPTKYNVDSDFTAVTGIFSKAMILSSLNPSVNFAQDDLITGTGVIPPKAIIDRYYDSAGTGFIYYHQNDSTGYQPFTSSMTITNSSGAYGTTLGSNWEIDPDIDRFNGELFFIDNRVAIPRDAESRQDLKIVIRF